MIQWNAYSIHIYFLSMAQTAAGGSFQNAFYNRDEQQSREQQC